ncbi:MAG: STAS/SEC14 domain-containing protein [Cellvibrionaceae bacterium]
MALSKHGISIGIERVNKEFFLSLKVVGTLQHDDYEVMVPMIESALEGVANPKIKAYVDCTELDGWELRALWDDFKLGVNHKHDFSKIALVGNKRWQELGVKVGSWFMSGEVKYFEDKKEGIDWLLL